MSLYVDIHDSKSASEMTYIVSGETLNSLTHSLAVGNWYS